MTNAAGQTLNLPQVSQRVAQYRVTLLYVIPYNEVLPLLSQNSTDQGSFHCGALLNLSAPWWQRPQRQRTRLLPQLFICLHLALT